MVPAEVQKRRMVVALLGLASLAFEFGVARKDWALEWALSGTQIGKLETHVIRRGVPEIVVFGNSRTLYGLHERQLADRLGLPPERVMKVAMNAGTVADYEWLYMRHRETLGQARLIVICVDAWELALMPTLRAREEVYGVGIQDAFRHDPRAWPLLLTTSLSRSIALARPLIQSTQHWLGQQVRPRPEQDASSGGLLGERDPDTEAQWRMGKWEVLEQETEGAAGPAGLRRPVQVVNDRHCLGRFESDWGLRELLGLVAAMKSDGARVMITRLPLSDRYFDDLHARFPHVAERFEQTLRKLDVFAAAHAEVDVIICGRASGLGLSDNAFYDYGHPSPLGRERITNLMALWASG